MLLFLFFFFFKVDILMIEVVSNLIKEPFGIQIELML